jgi:hypothetical protein
MSRSVRIGKRMVEISGLHGIWVGPNHLDQPRMTLFYLNRPTEIITYEYGKWSECDKDKKILEDAKEEFKKILVNGKNVIDDLEVVKNLK